MSYKPIHNDATEPDVGASAAVPLGLFRNLRALDEDRPPMVCHGWTQSEEDSIERPTYITAPFDTRYLPAILLAVAEGVRQVKVRVAYIADGSSDTRLNVTAPGDDGDAEDVLSATGTLALSRVFTLELGDETGIPREVNLRIDTNGEGWVASSSDNTGTFEPVGVCIVGVGGDLERPDPSAMAIGRPMYASTLIALERALWAIYRGRRWTFTGGPDESQGDLGPIHSIAVRNETDSELTFVGCLVKRRVDVQGVRAIVYPVWEGSPPYAMTFRWLDVSGSVIDTVQLTPGGGRVQPPGRAEGDLGVSTSDHGGDTDFLDAVDSRRTPGYLVSSDSRLPTADFTVPWPSGVDEGDFVSFEIVGGVGYSGGWGAIVTEGMLFDPPRSAADGKTTGKSIPTRWQPLSPRVAQVYPRSPIKGGAPVNLPFDFGPRALTANDRLVRASRFPCVLSRYRDDGWTHVNDITGVSPAEVVFESVPFYTLPDMTSLDVTTWADGVNVTVAVLDTGGSSVDSATLSHSGRDEQSDTLSVSAETWYQLRVSIFSPGASTSGTLYGVFVAGTPLSSV